MKSTGWLAGCGQPVFQDGAGRDQRGEPPPQQSCLYLPA
jgi:hypothetical protein